MIVTDTAARHLPSARPGYFTGVTVAHPAEASALVTVARDGKGGELEFNQVTARRRMAPVRLGARTVAFIGLSPDGPAEVSWGLDWTTHRANGAETFADGEAAVVALALAFLA